MIFLGRELDAMKDNRNNSEHHSGTVYRSLVVALFDENATLLIGAFATSLTITITAVLVDSIVMHMISALGIAIGLGRYWLGIQFQERFKDTEPTIAESRKWEFYYIIGAVACTSLLGGWCFAAGLIGDPFVRLVCVSTTLANLIGISSRSFAIGRLVNWQLITVSIPLIAGLYNSGGKYIVLGSLLIPFFFSLRKVAERQREVLLSNIYERLNAEKLATQFHTALNNIPQGICMFDPTGKLEVANQPIQTILGRNAKSLVGLSSENMLDLMVYDLGVSVDDASLMKKWSDRRDYNRISHTFNMGQDNSQTIRFHAAPMTNGGQIVTFENITKEVQAANRIDHMTRFDRLTGLINRNHLSTLLEDELVARKDKQRVAILMLNLRKFKQINDSMGHRVGDLLLCQVTELLKAAAEPYGTCARFGGDEFVVVYRAEDCLDLVTTLADSLVDAFSQPFVIEEQRISMECSIGIALDQGEDISVEEILKHADLACLWAQQDNQSDWRVFNQRMSLELQKRRKLEDDLRVALDDSQFEAYFQPLVSVKDRHVKTCEALIRWNHPRHGHVPPASFIPIAEEMGLIPEIGAWMLVEACKICATWPSLTNVAVNLSALQFKHGDIVQTVKNALEKTGLDPKRLELEITESLVLDDMGDTIAKLGEFKKMGVRIALDDFGTGYSSLSYMNTLPLDKVKIDRSFVQGLRPDSKALTLVQGVSALGRELGLCVVVEGVETNEEMEVLLDHTSVDEIQGYLFSKPLPEAGIATLLNRKSQENKHMLERLRFLTSRAA